MLTVYSLNAYVKAAKGKLRHPNMSTAFYRGHKATNQKDKICMVWLFLAVMLPIIFKQCTFLWFYILIPYKFVWTLSKCKHYGPRSDCSLMVIWEQPNQGSYCVFPYDQVFSWSAFVYHIYVMRQMWKQTAFSRQNIYRIRLNKVWISWI